MEKLAISVTEAAKVIGVSRATMYELVKSEGFPVIHVGTRLLVSVKGLERWVEDQTAKDCCTFRN